MQIGLKGLAIGLMAALMGIFASTVAGLAFTWSPFVNLGVSSQLFMGAVAGAAGATTAAGILRGFSSAGLLKPLGLTFAALSVLIGVVSLAFLDLYGWVVLAAWFAHALPWACAAIAAPPGPRSEQDGIAGIKPRDGQQQR
jgi:hypothetical protein